jgi:hypothetical protein
MKKFGLNKGKVLYLCVHLVGPGCDEERSETRREVVQFAEKRFRRETALAKTIYIEHRN